MAIRDLLPWNREKEGRVEIVRKDEDPVFALQGRMNEMFEQFWRDPFVMSPWQAFSNVLDSFSPRVDVTEDDKEVRVTAELPGLGMKDIDLSLDQQVLTIRGEKHTEKQEKSRQMHRVERSYGSFRRDIFLPAEVEADHAEAVFDKGVLTVVLPKPAGSAQSGRKIPIK